MSGRKTYAVAAAALITLGIAWSDSKITTESAIEKAVAIILASTMRAGIQKAQDSAAESANILKNATKCCGDE